MPINRRTALKALAPTVTLGMAGCIGSEEEEKPAETPTRTTQAEAADVRAAFVYHDVVGDFGWQWAHEQGRRQIESEFDWLETEIFQKCDPKGSARRFEQYAQRGFDIIFATSFDYMDPVASVAPEYPSVKFETCAGYKEGANMGRYFGRMYQARYLSGIAAGLLTEADHLGYVAAYPIPEVIRGINAFALGVAEVAEEATVQVSYTNTWSDASIESDAARKLIDAGVDVMAQHQNYPAAAQTASEAGIWALGYNSPMGDLVGDRYVTSPIWNWATFYRSAVTEVHEGTWESDFFWKGLESGMVRLSEWGPNISPDVKERVDRERDQLMEGNIDIWAGTQFAEFSDAELYEEMDGYVENVNEGPIA